jgi:hypothetical protein
MGKEEGMREHAKRQKKEGTFTTESTEEHREKKIHRGDDGLVLG